MGSAGGVALVDNCQGGVPKGRIGLCPGGTDDRSKVIYCLEYAQKGHPSQRDGVSWATRHICRPWSKKRPVDRIIPFPTGQRLSARAYEFDARSLQTERRLFEDEDE